MGTRANIGIVEAGKVRYIYTHWDGYPSAMGRTLLEHYNNALYAKLIVDGGDISSLCNRLNPSSDKPHTFDKPQEDVTVFYYRDRKENWLDVAPKVVNIPPDWNDIKENEYLYIWKDDVWNWIDDNGLFRQLDMDDCLTEDEKKNKPLTPAAKPDKVTNMKYKTVGIKTISDGNSEVAQYVAFGLGYKWNIGKVGEVQNTDADALVFYPETKVIKFAFTVVADKEVKTAIELAAALKNPETLNTTVESGGVSAEISKDGSVTLTSQNGSVAVSNTLLNEVFTARNEVLGVKEPALPLVTFKYRSQSDYYTRVRLVSLLSLDKDYLIGLDTEDDNKYKKYSVTSIEGSVSVVSFGKKS